MLVLLHAFPLSSQMWRRLVPLLDGVRAVTVDLPGLGASPVPDVDHSVHPSVDAMARGVLGALDDLGVATATFYGLSTGGYVALALAGLHPERVDALVLGSTTPWVIEPDRPDDRRATAAELDRVGTTAPVIDSADAGLGATAHHEQPGLRDELRDVIAAADPAGVAWVARALAARHDTSAVVRGLDRPLLLLFGDEDTDTPPERALAIRELRPQGEASPPTRLAVLPATGHLTAFEQPRAVADVLLAFLARDVVPRTRDTAH